MNNPEQFSAPPIVSAPTDQHAQNMWVLGVMKGRLDSVDEKLAALVDEGRIRNGRMGKAEDRLTAIERIQSEDRGQREAFHISWSTTSVIITLILGAVTLVYKFVHP